MASANLPLLNKAEISLDSQPEETEDLNEDKDEASRLTQKESLAVINEVVENTRQQMKLEGLSDDVIERFRSLWIEKLEKVKEVTPCSSRSKDKPHDVARGKKKIVKKKKLRKKAKAVVVQLDGPNDSSDDDEDLDPDDDDDDDGDDDDDDVNLDDDDDVDDAADEEPLGSGDDISDEDPSDLFNTSNVVVCQYDKITHARNKWKFHLKDGIMNLNGKDYVFQRANGDAEW